MPSQAYELARQLDVERFYHQTILFTDFVEKTTPKSVGTTLPKLALSLVNRLSNFCEADANNSIGNIRGGSMRSYLFDNYAVDEHYANIFSNIDQTLLGKDPMAGQVIDKVFSLPKDVDVFLHSKLPNSQVYEEDILFQNIIGELSDQGYIKQNENGNKIVFTNGQYQVSVLKHTTGKNRPQTLVKVDVTEGDQVMMKLHFGLIPDKQDELHDPRFNPETPDIEKEAVGHMIKGKNNEISIDYLSFEDTPDVVLFMKEKTHFLDPILHHFLVESEKNPDQAVSSRLREINFRVALFDWIKKFVPEIKDIPYYKLFIKFGMNYEGQNTGELESEQMIQWFQKHKDDIKDHFKLTASDITYGLTVNPFLFLLFTFSTHILDAFPLGKMLEFMPIMSFLEKIANQVGGSITQDSLQELSNKYYAHTKKAEDTTIFQLMNFFEDEPKKTFSAFLKLIDSLNIKTTSPPSPQTPPHLIQL